MSNYLTDSKDKFVRYMKQKRFSEKTIKQLTMKKLNAWLNAEDVNGDMGQNMMIAAFRHFIFFACCIPIGIGLALLISKLLS